MCGYFRKKSSVLIPKTPAFMSMCVFMCERKSADT